MNFFKHIKFHKESSIHTGKEKKIANKKTIVTPFSPAEIILSVVSLIEIAVNIQAINKANKQTLTETNAILRLDCRDFFSYTLIKVKE